ncbi:MAG: sulfite exporter TauE/SafE family protein [Candidatus Cloacimonetes bacterium]|nr:sulfite exporter TauE/SafE family protein [Candidatus Cloacimonadota bacterium]
MEMILLLLTGLLAGVLSGMFGIGGGVMIVPALMFIAGFAQLEANGTCLAALLPPVGILAVIAYYKVKLLHIKSSLLIAAGLLGGGFLGALLAHSLSSMLLKQLYGFFLLYLSIRFLKPEEWIPAFNRNRNIKTHVCRKPEDLHWWGLLILGLLSGVVSGLFGIGGGAVIVPMLTSVFRLNHKRAIAISLGALLGPVGLISTISYYQAGHLNITMAIPVAVGLLSGALLGAKITIGISGERTKQLYGGFIFLIAIYFVTGPWM